MRIYFYHTSNLISSRMTLLKLYKNKGTDDLEDINSKFDSTAIERLVPFIINRSQIVIGDKVIHAKDHVYIYQGDILLVEYY